MNEGPRQQEQRQVTWIGAGRCVAGLGGGPRINSTGLGVMAERRQRALNGKEREKGDGRCS